MLKNISLIVLSAALFHLPAEAAPGAALKIQYVGAVTISCSQDAAVLADWYTKFGVVFQHGGGYYWGPLTTASGPFLFGIHPKKADAPSRSSASVSVTFRVDDYSGYVAMLQGRGLSPESTESDSTGRFAHYRDPDGNEMTIWGN